MIKRLLNQLLRTSETAASKTDELRRDVAALKKLVKDLPSLLEPPVTHTPLSERLKSLLEDLIDFLGATQENLSRVEDRQRRLEAHQANLAAALMALERRIETMQRDAAREHDEAVAFRQSMLELRDALMLDGGGD